VPDIPDDGIQHTHTHTHTLQIAPINNTLAFNSHLLVGATFVTLILTCPQQWLSYIPYILNTFQNFNKIYLFDFVVHAVRIATKYNAD
jgi:hypothetical protein